MALVLWITGLPGSGKSSLADEIIIRHPKFALLRMDDLRKVVTPNPTYSETERDLVYRSLVFTARTLAESGRDVIIDATGNLRKWRELARSLIPNFLEVYLSCPIDICTDREKARSDTRGAPGDIYSKAGAGWPIPGVIAPYEEPTAPELMIDTENTSVSDSADAVETLIDSSRKGG